MMKRDVLERGRSMVEMMGYLAVVMSVVVAIGRIVSSAFDNHRYSTASVQVAELATAIVKAGAIDVDYTEILADINGDNNMNLVPSSFRRAGNKIFHVFGGEVKVDVSPFNDPDCTEPSEDNNNCKRVDQFSIKFDHLNKKQCVELALKNWQSNQYVDLFSLNVNGHYWFWPAYGDASGGEVSSDNNVFPVKRSVLTGTDREGVCVDGDSNVLTWVFN